MIFERNDALQIIEDDLFYNFEEHKKMNNPFLNSENPLEWRAQSGLLLETFYLFFFRTVSSWMI